MPYRHLIAGFMHDELVRSVVAAALTVAVRGLLSRLNGSPSLLAKPAGSSDSAALDLPPRGV